MVATRYINPEGSDSNDGMTPGSAWATPAKVVEFINSAAAGSEITIEVAAGDYAGGIYLDPNSGTVVTVNMEPGCTFDNTVTGSGIGNGSNSTSIWYLNGAVFNGNNDASANGISSNNSSTIVYGGGAVFDGYGDGFSCHGTSVGYASDCTFQNCFKSAFAHVNTSRADHYRCTFSGRTGSQLGLGTNNSPETCYFEDCDFVPSEAGQVITLENCELVRCRVGTPSFWVNGGSMNGTTASLTDCYINYRGDGPGSYTYRRCYGKFRVRIRGTSENTALFENCVFVGTPSGTDGAFSGSFYADENWVGGVVVIRNTIFINYSANVFSWTNTAQRDFMNTNWTVENCCFFNNAGNFESGLTLGSNLVLSDPLLGSADSLIQSDYHTGALSPCRLAGTPEGYHIGLPSRSLRPSAGQRNILLLGAG